MSKQPGQLWQGPAWGLVWVLFLSYSVFKSNSASLGTELFIFPLVKIRALAEHKSVFSLSWSVAASASGFEHWTYIFCFGGDIKIPLFSGGGG